MIDEINWTDFVTSFFNVDRTWIEHVTRNWNFLRNEPGCNCSIFLDRPIYCLDYTQLQSAKADTESTVIDDFDYETEGLGGT